MDPGPDAPGAAALPPEPCNTLGGVLYSAPHVLAAAGLGSHLLVPSGAGTILVGTAPATHSVAAVAASGRKLAEAGCYGDAATVAQVAARALTRRKGPVDRATCTAVAGLARAIPHFDGGKPADELAAALDRAAARGGPIQPLTLLHSHVVACKDRKILVRVVDQAGGRGLQVTPAFAAGGTPPPPVAWSPAMAADYLARLPKLGIAIGEPEACEVARVLATALAVALAGPAAASAQALEAAADEDALWLSLNVAGPAGRSYLAPPKFVADLAGVVGWLLAHDATRAAGRVLRAALTPEVIGGDRTRQAWYPGVLATGLTITAHTVNADGSESMTLTGGDPAQADGEATVATPIKDNWGEKWLAKLKAQKYGDWDAYYDEDADAPFSPKMLEQLKATTKAAEPHPGAGPGPDHTLDPAKGWQSVLDYYKKTDAFPPKVVDPAPGGCDELYALGKPGPKTYVKGHGAHATPEAIAQVEAQLEAQLKAAQAKAAEKVKLDILAAQMEAQLAALEAKIQADAAAAAAKAQAKAAAAAVQEVKDRADRIFFEDVLPLFGDAWSPRVKGECLRRMHVDGAYAAGWQGKAEEERKRRALEAADRWLKEQEEQAAARARPAARALEFDPEHEEEAS